VGGNTLPTVTQKDVAKYILENFKILIIVHSNLCVEMMEWDS
jgi:hypothetical protein